MATIKTPVARRSYGMVGHLTALSRKPFLSLFGLDPAVFERVGTYEAKLWRQAAQTIWILETMKQPPPALTRRRFRKPTERFYWDAEK
jgi:hypothetical protein